jgi:hypothetical protein
MLPRMVDTLGAVFKEYQINTTVRLAEIAFVLRIMEDTTTRIVSFYQFIQMTNLCNETLGDILDALSKCESISEDISQISQKCLRSVIESVARRKRSDANIPVLINFKA